MAMIHPIFRTVLRRPELFLKHAANHVELLKSELTSIGLALAIRAVGAALALVALLLALGLSGVAIMLGFLHGSFHPVLVVVPGAVWLVVLLGGVLALRPGVREQVVDARRELEADLDLLRLIKAANHD